MTDLEALVVAAYVFADEYPVPARGGRRALVSDAELVALAVAQAAIGISSDRQFLGLINRVLPGWFPHLPCQSQHNRSLRGLVELISIVQQRLARWLDSGGVRLSDGTLLGVASYPGCQRRSEFAGFAPFGFAKSQHRYVYGVRLVLPMIAGCLSATPWCRQTRTSTHSGSRHRAHVCSPPSGREQPPTKAADTPLPQRGW
jgi:hypothetical protein